MYVFKIERNISHNYFASAEDVLFCGNISGIIMCFLCMARNWLFFLFYYLIIHSVYSVDGIVCSFYFFILMVSYKRNITYIFSVLRQQKKQTKNLYRFKEHITSKYLIHYIWKTWQNRKVNTKHIYCLNRI